MTSRGATAAVQGFGNAGSVVARLLSGLGCRVIAVSDSKGGTYREQGLDAEALQACRRESGSVSHFPAGERITNEELLALPCDILVPAALENQLTERIAPKVRSRLVAEAANGPTTPEADAILQDRGITVIPDILANAGGVHGVLLRVGPEPAGVSLEGGTGQPAAQGRHGRQLRAGPGRRPTGKEPTCEPRPTYWGSNVSSTPFRTAASIPEMVSSHRTTPARLVSRM